MEAKRRLTAGAHIFPQAAVSFGLGAISYVRTFPSQNLAPRIGAKTILFTQKRMSALPVIGWFGRVLPYRRLRLKEEEEHPAEFSVRFLHRPFIA